jgi:hypothetical protein
MADARNGGVLPEGTPPYLRETINTCGGRLGDLPRSADREERSGAMIEILMIAQLVRNPLQAIARRWYCRSLFRATRGRRRCVGCTAS